MIHLFAGGDKSGEKKVVLIQLLKILILLAYMRYLKWLS